jgi:hypothetical protein
MSASAPSNLRKSSKYVPRRGGSGATTHSRKAVAETSFQHPSEHPELWQTCDLCSIPLPCNDRG